MLPISNVSLLREEIRQLKVIIAEQEETIVQLREALRPPDWEPPVELRLTVTEARVLATLYHANGEVVNKERLYHDLYHDTDQERDIKIIDVIICKIRKKLKPYDIKIKTHFGRGFNLEKEGVKIIRDWGLDSAEAQSSE